MVRNVWAQVEQDKRDALSTPQAQEALALVRARTAEAQARRGSSQ